ncbi:MAG: choice-of-anchor Q domain-containing protein, partial [Pseudobdellovibrionaceae bacterium]
WINIAMQGNVGIPNFRFYNNTLYNADYVNGFALYLYGEVWGDPTGARIINNIFIDAGGVDNTSVMGAYYIVKGSNIVKDYNYVARGPSNGYAALMGFSEPHGINGGDPKFIDISKYDFHLQQSSPAIDKGMLLAGFNYDADQVSRPQGLAWDIGAFEYGGLNKSLQAPSNLRMVQ